MGQQRPVTERNVGNIKGVIGRRKSKKDTKYIYRKKKKRTNNDLHRSSYTNPTKNWG